MPPKRGPGRRGLDEALLRRGLPPAAPSKPDASSPGGSSEPPTETSANPATVDAPGASPSVQAEPAPHTENRGDLPAQEETAPQIEN